jgi:hypothetical protein
MSILIRKCKNPLLDMIKKIILKFKFLFQKNKLRKFLLNKTKNPINKVLNLYNLWNNIIIFILNYKILEY